VVGMDVWIWPIDKGDELWGYMASYILGRPGQVSQDLRNTNPILSLRSTRVVLRLLQTISY